MIPSPMAFVKAFTIIFLAGVVAGVAIACRCAPIDIRNSF